MPGQKPMPQKKKVSGQQKSPTTTNRLGARQKQITFSGYSGNGIEVSFGKPWRLVLWEKTQYVPCWDLGEGVWMFNEWLETNSPHDKYCYEPMMDMGNKYCQARIIQKGPARTLVHWHYALCNQWGQIFHGNTTADEYYVTYPDGVTVRKLVAWPGTQSDFGGNPTFWEVGEWDIVNAKGSLPAEPIESPVLSLHNLKGDTVDLPWPAPDADMKYLCDKHPLIAGWNEYIGLLNLKDRPRAYTVIPRHQLLFPVLGCPYCGQDHPEFHIFPGAASWNFWPVMNKKRDWVGANKAQDHELGKFITGTALMCYQYGSTIRRKSKYPSRPLGFYRNVTPPAGTTWLSLNGAIEQDHTKEVDSIAAAWLKPAAQVATNWLFCGFSHPDRAYVFHPQGKKAPALECTFKNAELYNPVLILDEVVKNVTAVKVNGKPAEFVYQKEKDKTVVWVSHCGNDAVDIKVELGR
jgi:hypothetical protein